MPTQEWLKKEFSYGYDSGNIEEEESNEQRKREELLIGGNYKKIVKEVLQKYINKNDNVLELGPGRGSWSKAILNHLDKGTLTTLDYQDVTQWLDKKYYKEKLIPFQVHDIDYAFLEDSYYDFFWSFGVLCHNNINSIYQILNSIHSKLKKNALLIHQYADWEKLEKFSWGKGGIPIDFKEKLDDEIWWPRNNKVVMKAILEGTGFEIIEIDMNFVKRDSIFIAKKK